MKTYVVGDIHGGFTSLCECLDAVNFSTSDDRLIVLGDVCDGHKETRRCIDLLLTLKNCIFIRGNHDIWARSWMETGFELPIWWHQGGMMTAQSYNFDKRNVPQSHKDFIDNGVDYFIDEKNNLYVHGGFDERYPIQEQDSTTLHWNRDLICAYGRGYKNHPIEGYNKVFFGHTSTQGILHDWNATDPIIVHNTIALDTGGGWNGKLTIMDVDTLEYWQSSIQQPDAVL